MPNDGRTGGFVSPVDALSRAVADGPSAVLGTLGGLTATPPGGKLTPKAGVYTDLGVYCAELQQGYAVKKALAIVGSVRSASPSGVASGPLSRAAMAPHHPSSSCVLARSSSMPAPASADSSSVGAKGRSRRMGSSKGIGWKEHSSSPRRQGCGCEGPGPPGTGSAVLINCARAAAAPTGAGRDP